MSAGLWRRARDVLATTGAPLTARQVAELTGDQDEVTELRNIFYTMRREGHLERVDPIAPKAEIRWRLMRDARINRVYRRK